MLLTEMRNPNTTHIDRMTTRDMLKVMNDENRRVPEAVEQAIPQIVPLVEHIAQQLSQGGRMFFVGAGTSGRLGVLDAAECPPTFGVAPDCVVALLAGGKDAMFQANAGCEDDAEQGAKDLEAYGVTARDTVIGLSAAGGAKYVLGAMELAKKNGAAIGSVCCNPDVPMLLMADYPIFVNTGAEAITGSTRLKAGSAQKMVLNLISTSVMIKQGRVYENYMVSMKPTNEKLRTRAIATIAALTGCADAQAAEALDRSGDVRSAVEELRGGGEPV